MSQIKGLPPSIFTHKESLLHPSQIEPRLLERILREYYINEANLVTQAQQELSIDIYTILRNQAEKKQTLSSTAAFRVAQAEASILVLSNPEILSYAMELPPFYRLTRYLELCGEIDRGGKTLCIGSGTTIPEVMAWYLAPPEPAQMQQFWEQPIDNRVMYDRMHQFSQTHGDTLPSRPTSELRYLRGHAIAIEPDRELTKHLPGLKKLFSIPDNLIDHQEKTLGQLLKKPPKNIQSILWMRADPNVISGKLHGCTDENQQNQARTEMQQIFTNITALLPKKNGQFLFTAGTGNNPEEETDRENMLILAATVLPKLRRDVVLPAYTDKERLTFGGRYGNMGFVLAK